MFKKSLSYIPSFVRYIFSVYLVGMVCFSIFRLLLLFSEKERIHDLPEQETYSLLFSAFAMGFRFDTVISGYLLGLPLVFLAITYFSKQQTLSQHRIVRYVINVLFAIAFFLCACDIPFFNQFFMRLNASALLWLKYPAFVIQMIVEEAKYWWTTIPFLILIYAFCKLNKKLHQKFMLHTTSSGWNKFHLFSFIIFSTLVFVAIRGRINIKSPIRVGTAYFSNYALPNQLGLNPVFTFLRSSLNALDEKKQSIQLMDNELAIKNTQQFLGNFQYTNSKNPIARNIKSTQQAIKPNIVLVIMESMSAGKMGRYGNTLNLTPHLDSIANISTTFDHIYTAGIHTYNGIYSTLCSYPAIFEQHPMKNVDILSYNSLPEILKSHGYSTTYFTTHDEQFDNVAGFLSANGIEKIYSQKHYPNAEIKSNLGVSDDYMFDFSLPILEELHAQSKPFFVCMMTASDHGPYIVPPYFKSKTEDIKTQVIEYADWSIGKFLNACKTKSWFNNTVFVFIADHGSALNATYDMPLNYHHSPLIFHNTSLFPAQSKNNIGGQIDLAPTLLGYLNLPYQNASLGVDLNQTQRPFMYFNADNKYGVINADFFYINRKDGEASLFKYQTKESENYILQHPQLADSMKIYAESMMQTTQYLIQNRVVNGR